MSQRKKTLCIVVVDDHAIFRRGVRDILMESLPQARVVEAGDAPTAMRVIDTNSPDLVVLDISMPGRTGVDLLRDINQAHPSLPVLVLSMHPEEQYAVRVLKAGAAGYLTKMLAPNELVKAVEQILGGEQYVSDALGQLLARRMTRSEAPLPHELLSPREHEIMLQLAVGKPLKEIALDLSITIQTVSTHRSRILRKMGFKTNAELTRYAVEQKLI
ncbi:MAG TPA: DNA-binding response regulator [Verrucomicrobiales bacterium]|nr:DNA-binding response regulator [Verrucomicrobiales bacterium]